MNNLQGSIEVVGKIFSTDLFFNIPDYQRPFAWEDSNFQDLIDDLISAQSEKNYFLGTIVLHKKNERNSYDVVDGQQRLTSLLILFACLRDLIADPLFKKNLHGKILQEENRVDGIPEMPRVSVKDRQIFREIVLENGGTLQKFKSNDFSESQKRYIQAIKIFKSSIDKYTQEQLQKFVQFINQHCTIIYLSASTFNDAFKLFTIVNDRGRQLRRIDILKAQNISPEAVPIEMTRDRLSKQWESMENDIGEKEFESILYSMRMILLKEKPQEDLLQEFENRIFKKDILQRGEKFIDEVKIYSDIYRQIFIDKDYLPKTDPNHLKYKAMIHIMDSEFEASEWRSCLMFFAKKFSGENFYDFMLLIEKVYLQQWVDGVRKDERFGVYAKILKSIESETSASNVIKNIKFDKNSIINAGKSKNLYGNRFCRYFLLRLEVISCENDIYKEINAKSIEHIFPQKPDPSSQWSHDPNISEHKEVVNTLGNLVLLSKSKNSSASNHDFSIKKEKYLKDRMSDYPRSLQVTLEENWTIQKIKDLTEKLSLKLVENP
ncbi:DUF262 domain-containing protein [Comamonas kerstersii]|uniref:DUF262 domain-containing protein n=1 Tax=Comamonas kerstersii TaxID=225992 RepID=A0A6A1R144_9BURK|nr:DUF262 domain-containing protein [Comamonas kerstersii]KAB0586026.1 DUF262 domain-containing protein [Comamonas kerstersii]